MSKASSCSTPAHGMHHEPGMLTLMHHNEGQHTSCGCTTDKLMQQSKKHMRVIKRAIKLQIQC